MRTAAIGQVTDDTEMTIALINGIIKNGGSYSFQMVVNEYMEWANSGPVGMGRNTRSLLNGVKTFNGYQNRWAKNFPDEQSKFIAQSNGSLMRCSPLCIFDDSAILVNDCSATNPNTINTNAEYIYLYLLRTFLLNQDINNVWMNWDYICLLDIFNFNLIDNPNFDVNVGSNKGWVLNALYCALHAIRHFDNYSSAIDWVNGKGGDSDTNSAIAGALMGMKLGFNRMMQTDQRFAYNWNKVSTCDTRSGDYPRPDKYHPTNMPQLANALAKYIRL